MDLATFLIQCLNSLQYGLLLFLVASGLTLIFGIMGVINLAHGSFYMLGAYLAFALAPWFGDWFVTRLVVGVALAALFGYVLEWVPSHFDRQRQPRTQTSDQIFQRRRGEFRIDSLIRYNPAPPSTTSRSGSERDTTCESRPRP